MSNGARVASVKTWSFANDENASLFRAERATKARVRIEVLTSWNCTEALKLVCMIWPKAPKQRFVGGVNRPPPRVIRDLHAVVQCSAVLAELAYEMFSVEGSQAFVQHPHHPVTGQR